MSDRAIGLLLLVFCGVMWSQTYAIRTPAFAQFQQLDSPFFPRLIIILLAICSAILLVRGTGRLVPAGGPAGVVRVVRDGRHVLVTLALFVLYVLAMPILGYVPATTVYLVAMQLYLRPRGPKGIAAVVLLSAVGSYALALVFTQFLHVVLPRGEF